MGQFMENGKIGSLGKNFDNNIPTIKCFLIENFLLSLHRVKYHYQKDPVGLL
jgi:hypothetical protein